METEAPTDPQTEVSTEEFTYEIPVAQTEASTIYESDSTANISEKGCGASMASLGIVILVAIACGTVLLKKKNGTG